MQFGVLKVNFTYFLGLVAAISLLSCTESTRRAADERLSPGGLVVDVADDFSPLSINSILLLPLRSEVYELETSALDKQLSIALQRNTSLATVGLKEIPTELRGFGFDVIAKKLAGANDVQGVLYGTVLQYKVDDADQYHEGMVDISLSLFDTAKNRVVWHAKYRDKIEPLSNNLLQIPRSLKRGLKNRSSLELATAGFQEAARNIEQYRAQAVIAD